MGLVEEKELLVVSEKQLIEFQRNRENELRDLVKSLSEKLEAAKAEIIDLKEKARKRAPPPPIKKNESDAEDGQDKDPDEVKRYGDDLDVDEDDKGSDKEDDSDDESDKENTKVQKKKRSQIDSDDEDNDEDSKMSGEGED